jgi:hypothetical protein
LLKAKEGSRLELLNRVKDRLKATGYSQVPDLLGPDAVKTAKVPWSKSAG